MTLKNTIVANGVAGPNCQGTITDGGGNLQFGGTGVNSCGASITTCDPQLGALLNNGATDADDGSRRPAARRSIWEMQPRAQPTPARRISALAEKISGDSIDAAAFVTAGPLEAQPVSNTIAGGSGQSTTLNTAFPIALQVTVRDINTNLLGGSAVTYTPPPSGPSATLAGNPTLSRMRSGLLL